MAAPSHQPIAVNMNIVIDASGNLDIFNAAAPVVGNVIIAEHTLPVTALYDPEHSAGLLELWEPVDAQGDINVQLADTDRSSSGGFILTGAYQKASKKLASGLEAILCDKFDCRGAAPFSAYSGNEEYYKQRDFGRVALATYAHHLFGHVDATAAITNDKAFVQAMLSISAGGDNETVDGAAARAAAWTKSTTANIQAWDVSSSSADANLALRLIKTLVAKGLDATGAPTVSSVNAGETDSLANIVSQVVGQDASRLMNMDNSQRTRDQHILLRFYPGDIIYMNITVKAPNVSVGTTSQLVSKAALEAMYPSANNNFTLKITLSPAVPVSDPNITYSDATKKIVTGYNGTIVGTLVIPEGVTEIATGAFQMRTDLTLITFPSTLTKIGNVAFTSSGLSAVTIPSNITYGNAFSYCGSLKTLVFLPGITEIFGYSFYGCTSLTSITVPNGVTSIGDAAFANNYALKSIELPAGCVLNPFAFNNVSNLQITYRT